MAKKQEKKEDILFYKKFSEYLVKASKKFNKPIYAVNSGQFWSVVGNAMSEWEVRKKGGFTGIRDLVAPANPNPDSGVPRLTKQIAHENKMSRQAKDMQIVLNTIENLVDKVFGSKVLPPIKPIVKPSKKTNRVLTAVWSDLHIGSDIDGEETGTGISFGKIEESRRLASLTRDIINYKKQYRQETELNLLLLGDIIQNQLHDARDGDLLAEQSCRAIHLLSQSIRLFSANFKKVTVRCSTGNHGRNTGRHHSRATYQKYDSFESIIYYALKKMFENNPNVEFDIPKAPYIKYSLFGLKFFATHGDTVIKSGYPSRSIPTNSIEAQINSINSSLPDHDEFKCFIVGHVHVASQTHLNNGSVLITNGAMVPTDSFSISMGNLENQSGQWIFETVDGFAVGDSRLIRVGPTADKDKSLDQIIVPYKTMNEK